MVKLDRLIAVYGEDRELGFNDTAVSIVIGKMRRLMFNPYAWQLGFDYDDLMLQVQVSQPMTDKKILSGHVFRVSENEYSMIQYVRGDDEFDKYHGIYFLFAEQAEPVFNALKADKPVVFEFDSPASGKIKVPIKAQGFSIAVKMYEACLGV